LHEPILRPRRVVLVAGSVEPMMPKPITLVKNVTLDPDGPFVLISGPCVLETRDLALKIAETVKGICSRFSIPYIFKASFDKANRTSGASHRGPGLEEGLRMLEDVRREVDVPVLTDVHESTQVPAVASVVDMLQVPAFLCRQTDLLVACGASGKPVNVKKGQFLAAEDMAYAVEKVRLGGNVTVTLTERGSTYGYRDLVVDLRSLVKMREYAPVIFDGTHAVQFPGGEGGRTGGNRKWVPMLVRGALAVGVDGIFLEVHPDPESSPSDGPNMITPQILEHHLPLWLKLDSAVRNSGVRE